MSARLGRRLWVYVKDGDEIEIDVGEKTIRLLVSDDELKVRQKNL